MILIIISFLILASFEFDGYYSQKLLVSLQNGNDGNHFQEVILLFKNIFRESLDNKSINVGYCDFNYQKMPHQFHSSYYQNMPTGRCDSRECLYKDKAEISMISFADVFLLELLQQHNINVLFGEEHRLPAAYCGLSMLVGYNRSPFLSVDYYLQVDIDFNITSLARVMDLIWSHLQRQPNLFSSAVLCSASRGEGVLISPLCDGKFVFSSFSVAQKLLTAYTEALGGRVPDLNALSVANSQPLSEDDKLSRLQGCLQVLSHEGLLDLAQLDGDSDLLILSEVHQPFSRDESHEDVTEVDQTVERRLLPPMSAFTNVTEKFVSDGSCRMGWPLNNSAVFVLDELYWLNDDLPSLSILLYCDIPHIGGEEALDDDLAISVQVDFYIAGQQFAPVLMQGRSSDLRRAVLSVDLPRLRLQGQSVDLTQVRSSIAVSVFSSRGTAIYAELEADFHFEFGAIGQTKNRTPAPNSFHAEMVRLGRDNFYALLNALGLTGVAVEIGVYTGDFAMRMLRNWRGNRYVMVDPWRHWSDADYPDESNDPQEEQDERFRSVQAKVAEHHAANLSRARAAILRLTSDQAATLFVDDSLDFCYIDAQHDFLSVMQDITRWWPKVRSGGIIAGHDFNHRRWVFPVALAVLRFARVMGLQLFFTGEEDWASWYIFKP